MVAFKQVFVEQCLTTFPEVRNRLSHITFPDNALRFSGRSALVLQKRLESMRSLNELERLGYLERRQLRDEQGRFIDTEYVIYEVPRSIQPPEENPEPENPETALPPAEKPPQLNNRYNQGLKNKGLNESITHSIPAPTRSEMNEAAESVREQIEYDLIVGEDGYDSELVDEAVTQIVEAICTTKSSIRTRKESEREGRCQKEKSGRRKEKGGRSSPTENTRK